MSNISIIYNTSTESNVTQEFNTADELKNFISNNKANFTGAMKVVCDNSITDCGTMFYNCPSLTSLDLSEFDTSKVTNMSYMFYNCSSLTLLDLSNFNTSKVTNMSYMFYSCQKLINLNINNFDTSKVTNMNGMFRECKALTLLNVSNFNTSKVTSMIDMFNGCSNITLLDLSKFDTSNVARMAGMFYNCQKLTTIYCEQNWNNSNITNSAGMFSSCTNLKGAISYDSTKVDINYANPTTGYFSYLPSRKFLVNLNMDQNEIKNMLLDKRNTNSLNPVTGQIYYNKIDKKTYLYNGTEWEEIFSYKEDFSLTEAQAYEPIS